MDTPSLSTDRALSESLIEEAFDPGGVDALQKLIERKVPPLV